MTAQTFEPSTPTLPDMPRLPETAGADVVVNSAPELSGPTATAESDDSVFASDTSDTPSLADAAMPTLPDLPTLPDVPAAGVPTMHAHDGSSDDSVARQVDIAPTRKSTAGYGELPTSNGPSEATLAARSKREAAKKRAKRFKLLALVIVIAMAALAGPPLVSWVQDGLNDAGNTTTDEVPSDTTDAPADAPADAETDTSTGG